MTVEIKCEMCGKVTRKRPYEVKKYQHHFCSRNCMFDYIRKHGHSTVRNNDMLLKINTYAEMRKELYPNKEKKWFYGV